ncbi:AAA domain-containing protein [Candidatus Cloacimonadota bacterium]
MVFLAEPKAIELCERLLELSTADSQIIDRMLKLRQALEQLYKSVTEDSKISFNGLFARMQYANDAANLSQDLQTSSNQLRMLCNKIAHEEVREVAQDVLDTSLYVLYLLIQHFCQKFQQPALEEYLGAKQLKHFKPVENSPKQSFICVVETWQVNSDERGDTSLSIVAMMEDGTQVSILLNNDDKQVGHDGKIYTKLAKSLWKYASLYFHELSSVAGRDGFYQSNPLTMVVLEPDFLVDASAIAECFGNTTSNPALFILSRMFIEPSSEAMLQGSVVNSILDDLVFTPEGDYLELFKHSLASMPIGFVASGKEAAKRIYDRVQTEHLPQLKDYVAGLGDDEVLLEPSYICPEYGLQGRLDLLRRKDDKFSIIELKSGKAHPYDVWTGHQMQTIAYNMIIRSVYGAQRVSNASILYSISKDKPVRHVVTVKLLEQDLLMCRNRILGLMHLLSCDPDAFFTWLKTVNDVSVSPFMQAKLVRFQALIVSLEDYEYFWFTEQVKRIVREIWFVKTGDNGSRSESSLGYSALWQKGIKEKQAEYKIIAGLKPIENTKKQISFTIPQSDEIADFRDGDIVVLYSMDEAVTRQEILRGIITKIDKDTLELRVRGGLRNSLRFDKDSLWAVEHDTLESSLYAPLSSLVTFLSSSSEQRKLILGLRTPEEETCTQIDDHSIDAILSRMHAAKELFIVQGPPGTGKTSGLLGKYVKQIYEDSGKRIFILSYTNRAVDEICLCLLRADIPFLRIGNSSQITEQLLSNNIEGRRFEEIQQVVLDNRIWIATVQSSNAWYKDMVRLFKIDEIIIDEASQIIENSILGLISHAPKTIMIGDQNQLGAICVQDSLPFVFEHPNLQTLHYGSYQQSLMERLYKIHNSHTEHSCTAMLRLHYRMHASIAALIGSNYDNQLICGTDAQKEDLPPNPKLAAFLNHRLVWVSTPASKASHYDMHQVELISGIVQNFIKTGAVNDPAKELGIVAPFRAMIHVLREAISPIAANITIDTVERFQGSERDNIILCLPLKSESDLRLVESLSDDGLIDRKLNVALSRAKQRIIIIGNPDICRKSLHYNQLIDDIADKGVIIGSHAALIRLNN